MEDVLDLYAQPYEPRRPVVWFAERPCQLLMDVREPLPMQPGRPRRADNEYKRQGSCNRFLRFQPLAAWRKAVVTARRTSEEFAYQMKALVDAFFPQAEVIRVGLDKLNIHTPAALDQAFPAQQARRITRQLELHYTPKHGRWLHMVESECSILVRQCLNRRLPDIERMRREVEAWEKERNDAKATVAWRFTTADARTKLQRLYPK
mgnify:FL=1